MAITEILEQNQLQLYNLAFSKITLKYKSAKHWQYEYKLAIQSSESSELRRNNRFVISIINGL